ncbi:MAG: hypothetical protein ACRDI2_13100 [Chloroflexota bacterium]
MIVLDEQLHGRRTVAAVSSWYRGHVISVTALRPGTVIKDDAIPVLLRRAVQPTFVTINVRDFWGIAPAHDRYCIVTLDLPATRISDVSKQLRRLLRLREFSDKASRMGKVLRVTSHVIDYYGTDGLVRSIIWPQ